MKGSCRGLICGITSTFSWKAEKINRKPLRIVSLRDLSLRIPECEQDFWRSFDVRWRR